MPFLHALAARAKVGGLGLTAPAARPFSTPSVKAVKNVFLWSQLPPICKKVHSVPCLTGEHGRAEADGRLLQRKKCRTLVALLRNVFISDVVRLVWLLNRFNEDVDFSNYSDFLLQRGRFDRLCWQLVFGTFFSARRYGERPPWDVTSSQFEVDIYSFAS